MDLNIYKNNLEEKQQTTIGNEFDKYFYIPKKTVQDILDSHNNDFAEITKLAKEGDKDAKLILINYSKSILLKVFWDNFIGKNLSGKRISYRIKNDDAYTFFSIVNDCFDKAIKAFNPNKVGENILGGFQYYISCYTKAGAISENKKRMKNNYDEDALMPDSEVIYDDDENVIKNSWDKISSQIVNNDLYFNDQYNGFDESWEKFCKDPKIINNDKYDIAGIFIDMLDGLNVKELCEKYNGIAPNTLRNSIMKNIIGVILKKYEIEPLELIYANKRNLKYLNLLKRNNKYNKKGV